MNLNYHLSTSSPTPLTPLEKGRTWVKKWTNDHRISLNYTIDNRLFHFLNLLNKAQVVESPKPAKPILA